MPATIRILPAGEIDPVKWSKCVADAANGLIYSNYEYLNMICDNWHGLVIDDYKTVMALPWRKKFGIRYVYAPAFSQQHGIIGNDIPGSFFDEVYSFKETAWYIIPDDTM